MLKKRTSVLFETNFTSRQRKGEKENNSKVCLLQLYNVETIPLWLVAIGVDGSVIDDVFVYDVVLESVGHSLWTWTREKKYTNIWAAVLPWNK